MIVSLFSPRTIRMGDRAGSVVPGWLPSRWETTWAEFVEVLRETSLIPADPAEKSTVTSYSCAEFASGANRSKAGVLGCDLIGFDFDDKTGTTPGAWTFEALVSFMEEQGAPFVVHTTTSCREAAHCLRLLIPFDRRVGPTEFPRVWRAFSTWLGSVADEATKDESRLFFEPRRWKGRYNCFHSGHTDRAPIGVGLIVERYSPPPPISATPMRAATLPLRTREGGALYDITDLDRSPIISPRALEEALTARPGGRMYRFLCSVACRAQREGVTLMEGDLVAIALALAGRMRRRDNADIRRDVISALRFAERAAEEQADQAARGRRATVPRYW